MAQKYQQQEYALFIVLFVLILCHVKEAYLPVSGHLRQWRYLPAAFASTFLLVDFFASTKMPVRKMLVYICQYVFASVLFCQYIFASGFFCQPYLLVNFASIFLLAPFCQQLASGCGKLDPIKGFCYKYLMIAELGHLLLDTFAYTFLKSIFQGHNGFRKYQRHQNMQNLG